MEARELHTTSEIVKALGGNGPTARLTGRTTQHVWNWKNAGRFPADTFLILSKELEDRGYRAVPELWGITQPESAAS